MKTNSIKQTLTTAITKLAQLDCAQLESDILLAHCLNKPRSFLHAWPETLISKTESEHFDALIQRRIEGEPIAYIIGQQEFWSLPFTVNQDTLTPRPETELLVETALNLFQNTCLAIDLGTGSGCIALALAHEHPLWDIYACDQSVAALQIAQTNASNLNIDSVKFLESNWFEKIPEHNFDLIISNPPYIASNDPHLEIGGLRFEPRNALVSGDDGFNDIRMLIKQLTPI